MPPPWDPKHWMAGNAITLALPVGWQSVYERLPQSTGTLRSALTISTYRSLQALLRQIPAPTMPIQRNSTNLGEAWVPTPISELESCK